MGTPESPKNVGVMVVADRKGPELSARVSSLVGFFDHGVGEQGLTVQDDAASLDLIEARTLQSQVVERQPTLTEKISLILDSIPGARILPHLIPDPKLKLRDQRKIHTLDSLSIKYTTFSKTNTKSLSKFPLSITSRRTLTIQDTPLETRRPTIRKPIRIISPHPNTIPSPTMAKNTFAYPVPSPEWMEMMEHSVIHDNGKDGKYVGESSKQELNIPQIDRVKPPQSTADGPTDNAWNKQKMHGRTMAEVIKGAQPPSGSGPVILDASRVKQRGMVSQEEGIPCLSIPDTDNDELAGRLGLAIVGKFSHSIPAAHMIRKALGNIKLEGTLNWNYINAKHILIILSKKEDYVKVLNGPNNNNAWFIEHHPMRVFKWTPDFDMFFETPIAAVWCNLHALPIHFFEESMLTAIGKLFGNPIQVDHNTITRARMSYARICVEIDISKPVPEKYILRVGGKDVTLPVKWDKIPLYCKDCRHVGHTEDRCYAFGKKPPPPKKDFSRPPQKQPEGNTRQGEQPRETQGDRSRGGGNQHRGVGQWVEVQRKGAHTGRPQGNPSQQQDRGKQKVQAGTIEEERRHKQAQMTSARAPTHATAQEIARGQRDYIPSGSLQIWDPVIELSTPMAEMDSTIGKKKKNRRSPASRERYRERRRQQRLIKIQGYITSDSGKSEFETDDSEDEQGRARSFSPTHRGDKGHIENTAGITVHSNRFEILEDDPTPDELAMVVHEGNADRRIIQEAKAASFPKESVASNGDLMMTVASNGDSQAMIEGPVKKARVSTSRTA